MQQLGVVPTSEESLRGANVEYPPREAHLFFSTIDEAIGATKQSLLCREAYLVR